MQTVLTGITCISLTTRRQDILQDILTLNLYKKTKDHVVASRFIPKKWIKNDQTEKWPINHMYIRTNSGEK